MMYLIYNKLTGEPLQYVDCHKSQIDSQVSDGYLFCEKSEQVMPTVQSSPSITVGHDNILSVSGVPPLSWAQCQDESFTVNDGVIEIAVDQAGSYEIIINNHNYAEKVHKFEAIN
jgi:hypothetical protein